MKIKNMIYLTISYIPWIVYWTISANLKPYGGVVAIILEVILVGMQKMKKNYSFMDVLSSIYFMITIISNYIIKADTFIIGDGYMGYAWLFIMSILSFMIKKPFMEYYIKKDFKNQDVTIGKVSELINFQTRVWSVVFFMDIWVFVFIHIPTAAVIISNIFVLIGIILSIYNENR